MFDQPLPTTRRVITIYDKMQVVQFYQKLQKEEREARLTLAEPKNACATREERDALKAAKKMAKDRMKRNKQHACKKAFGAIVGSASVWKWVKTAKHEAWSQLPEQVQRKLSATPNAWRAKCGLKKKGRNVGSGVVPLEIQQELDHLILDHALGRSEVSERREAITTDTVVPWNAY